MALIEKAQARLSIHVHDASVMLQGPDRSAIVGGGPTCPPAGGRHPFNWHEVTFMDKVFSLASDEALERLKKALGAMGGGAVQSVRT